MKPDIGRESRFLPTPPAFNGSPSEYWHNVRYGKKTRMVLLLEKIEVMFTRIDIIQECDGQTERQTDTA